MIRRFFQVSLIPAALILMLTASILAQNQHQHSPYVDQEKNEIKALNQDEVESYLTGKGMGLAKAAELNLYPGPLHVIELAKQLQLSPEQLARTKVIYDRMHQQAVKLGEQIVEREKALNQFFASRQITPSKLEALVGEIAELQGKLRTVHLQAHLETTEVLTRFQSEKYGQLRGYQSSH